MNTTVIIGNGAAGTNAAATLRMNGYEGAIKLIGDEVSMPYQRPPLSKAYLSGEMPVERLWLKPETFYPASNIACMTNIRATAPSARRSSPSTS